MAAVLATAFWICGGLIALAVFYPLIPLIAGLGRSLRPAPPVAAARPSVSVVVPVRSQDLGRLREKLASLAASAYPLDRLEVVVAGDGPIADRDLAAATAGSTLRIVAFSTQRRVGKNLAVNQAVARCGGEILVFSDVDAALAADAIGHLAAVFAEPLVGGACGSIEAVDPDAGAARRRLDAPQAGHWQLENAIRSWEMRALGSVTSNNGALFALRAPLFRPIPAHVNDDLFSALSVVAQGHRFVFVAAARVGHAVPAKDPWSEIARRRRIVARSFGSLWHYRGLLLQVPLYSACLAVHKALRRLIPALFLASFALALALAPTGAPWPWLAAGEGTALLLAAAASVLPGLPRQASYAAFFGAAGIGMTLGVIDFARGRRRPVWN